MKMPADFVHSKVLAAKTPAINPGAEVLLTEQQSNMIASEYF
jgi:hypothetical protein